MIERTSNLQQYGVVVGRKLYRYKRADLNGKAYREPKFIGITWHKSKREAEEAKAQFDKPIKH